MNLLESAAIAIDLTWNCPLSIYGSWKHRKLFEDVETYCMFLGCARSGKSLTASLLDAHPAMVIADEVGALRYLCAGFSREQIYYLLLRNSRSFTSTGRISKNYSFQVPNQWQGRYKELRVIGDNQGQGSIVRLGIRPWLLQRLHSTIGVNIRFIHVIRNPYDNISAIVAEMRRPQLDLESSAEFFFTLCETVADIKKRIAGPELFELRYESLVECPPFHLEELCHFMGVGASSDYLRDCASIVFQSPHKSRYDVQWNRELIDIVRERIEHFPFLHGYTYES